MSAWYCTIEDVRDALEQKTSAYDDRRIGQVIDAASRDVDDVVQLSTGCFRPETTTRYYDWPPAQNVCSYRLRLDGNPLISVSALVSGGVTIASSNYFLEPQRYGPPYDRIEIDRSSSAAFAEDGTPQRAVAITGLWGVSDDRESAGTLVGSVSSSDTAWVCSNGLAVGVGDHLVVGTERVIVTGKGWTDSAQNTTGALTASMADNAVGVATGSAYVAGEEILIGTERMLILDVAGNTLTVKRAWNGTVLAAHSSNADVYVRRALTVTRGAQGSTAAGHTSGDALSRHVVPGDVLELTVASASASLLLGRSAYSREGNSGSSGGSNVAAQTARSEKVGAGLDQLRQRVAANYGRQMRHLAV